jgi:hypothetical protein
VDEKKYDAFVSYSRHDEDFVRPLADVINAVSGDTLFIDVEQLRPGDLWEKKIVGAIRQSSVFILCWCCECRKSTFVAKEIALALEDKEKKIVPVLLCYSPLPEKLSERQWVDLRKEVAHKCDGHSYYIDGIEASAARPKREKRDRRILYQGAVPKPRTKADLIASRARRYFKGLRTE